MQMAISAIRNQKIQLKRKAAGIFRVSEAILYKQLKGRKQHSETHINSYKLTVIEEEVLTKQLLDIDKQGFSIQPEFLCGMAQILLYKQTQDSTIFIDINWAYNFIKHYLALCTQYN
mgnify:CR=1 FL=1